MLAGSDQEPAMNAFYEHHKDSIRFGYRCFDRILLNGLIQPFQQPERVVGFFDTYRRVYPVSRDVLRGAAEQFQGWVKEQADRWSAPVVEAPKGRPDEFVEPYFRGANPDQVVVILKAREPARIMTAIGDRKTNRRHLQIADRWVVQYNFYVNDQRWGRMFVRMCPYLPFSARVCLNQHHWLANRMREEHLDFQQCSNAFLRCGTPERLQELADTLTAEDFSSCGQKWLARLTPFFSERERRHAGCQHRLFFSQVEFCDNLIFYRRAALDKLGERLLDANRTIGQPNKITVIFGRRITKQYRGKLQTEIEDMQLPNPVIRSHYRNGFIKQYARDHLILRTEAATNNVTDYGVNKAVEHLPALRDKLRAIVLPHRRMFPRRRALPHHPCSRCLTDLVVEPRLPFSILNQFLLTLALWSCGRRVSVVQAQRQIHRALRAVFTLAEVVLRTIAKRAALESSDVLGELVVMVPNTIRCAASRRHSFRRRCNVRSCASG
jgi:hypothetical protein